MSDQTEVEALLVEDSQAALQRAEASRCSVGSVRHHAIMACVAISLHKPWVGDSA